MIKKIAGMLAGLAALSGVALASDGQVFNQEDAAPALRIKNSGTETVSIAIGEGGAAATNTVTIGSTVNTIDGSGAIDTVAELASAIAACTNSAGKKVLSVDTSCVVATTESTDGELLDGTTVIRAGDWGQLNWDTSDTLHYRAYIPVSEDGAKRGGLTVKKAYGNPGGTGNVTVSAYVNGAIKFEKVVVSPVYVKAVDNNTNVADAVVFLDIPMDLYVGQNDYFLLSVDRATTATTGGMGVTTENK